MCRLIAKQFGSGPRTEEKEARHAYPYTSSGLQMGMVRQSIGQPCCLPTVVLNPDINHTYVSRLNRRLTVPMDDAGWLRQSLHPQNSPQVYRGVGVLALRWISTQHEQIVAKNSDERTGCHLWGQAFHLNCRCVSMGVDHLESDSSLPNDSRQAQGPIHNQTPCNQVSNGT